MNRMPKTVTPFILTLAVVLLPCQMLAASGTQAPGLAAVVCSAEQPVARRGETISIHAWVPPSDVGSAPRGYKWVASGGHIVGQDATATWTLDTEPGLQSASVRVGQGQGESSLDLECSVRVLVKDTERGDTLGNETGRSLLVRGHAEEKGYALYSYLLLGSPPDEGSRDRYVEVLTAYWKLVPALKDLEAVLPRSALNVTYLPVETAPEPTASAEWALDHYDYARARALLRPLSGNHHRGPYLISSLQPIVPSKALAGCLYQDLSSIPPRLAGDWMREFLNEDAQYSMSPPRTPTLEWLMLTLRTWLVVAATGLHPVLQDIDELIVRLPKLS
jgi:hypothetical protein